MELSIDGKAYLKILRTLGQIWCYPSELYRSSTNINDFMQHRIKSLAQWSEHRGRDRFFPIRLESNEFIEAKVVRKK